MEGLKWSELLPVDVRSLETTDSCLWKHNQGHTKLSFRAARWRSAPSVALEIASGRARVQRRSLMHANKVWRALGVIKHSAAQPDAFYIPSFLAQRYTFASSSNCSSGTYEEKNWGEVFGRFVMLMIDSRIVLLLYFEQCMWLPGSTSRQGTFKSSFPEHTAPTSLLLSTPHSCFPDTLNVAFRQI